MNYTITASEQGTLIDIQGEFTSRFPEACRQVLDAVFLASTRVEISLGGVTSVDPGSAEVLIKARAHGRKVGVPVLLRGATEKVSHTLFAA